MPKEGEQHKVAMVARTGETTTSSHPPEAADLSFVFPKDAASCGIYDAGIFSEKRDSDSPAVSLSLYYSLDLVRHLHHGSSLNLAIKVQTTYSGQCLGYCT